MRKSFSEEIKQTFSKNLPNIPLFVYDSVPSTNDEAKKFAISDRDKRDAVFIARTQSAGRGRHGRSFLSDAGGLYFSYLMHPDLPSAEAIKLTLYAAVCVCSIIEDMTGLCPRIKWVNDILMENKKVSGILTEGSFGENGKFDYAVIGIGVNIGKNKFGGELKSIATDIEKVSKKRLNIAEFAVRLAALLGEFYSAGTEHFMNEYRIRSAVIGRTVKVIGANESYDAYAIHIDDDGVLVVKMENGEEKRLISGEISIKL